ncbi:MAG: NTP transferase domain-containing protein [Flavobacteriales bacterium]|jgi:molybdenum cofactor cytidylyltransferase|nr:NTP transferase domain-containing protein [Flavobacteriales bacterium]
MLKNTGVLILAGGRSSRMDFPKPWLQYDERSSFLERIIHIYQKVGVTDIATVVNSDFCEKPWDEKIAAVSRNCKVIRNDHPNFGRLYSIQLGLAHLQSDNIYIHNVDSPFVNEELIVDLAAAHHGSGVTIPVKEGRKGHPILIGSDVKKTILARYEEFNSLRDLIMEFEQKLVDTDDDGIFVNINTPEQYKQLTGERIR